MGLYDSTGSVVARYAYDAWGRVLTVKDGSGNILNPTENSGEQGIINPFRYRGYMYDDESGLYYLNSRYYEPIILLIIGSYKIGEKDDYIDNRCIAYRENCACSKAA